VVLNPRVSPLMNQVVLRTLQKKPGDRFATMKDLREALEAVPLQQRAPIPAPAPAPARVAPAPRVMPASKPSAVTPSTAVLVRAPAPMASAPTMAAAPRPRPQAPAAGHDLPGRLVGLVQERLSAGTIDIPALPPATVRCMELLRRSNLGFAEAAQVIDNAPSLRSRIMRLANSSAFPSLMPATTLEIAIARLGTEGLHTALVEFSARETLAGKHTRVREAFRRSWPHALGTALIASQLCEHFDREKDAPAAYLSGILHDAGKPLVGTLLLEFEQQLIRAGNRSVLSETAWLGAIERCHREAGALLARRWQLAPAIGDAIENSGAYDTAAGRALSNIARFSEALANRLGLAVGPTNAAEIDAVCAEGRRLLKIDDGTERTLSHGLKERAIALAAIRGQ
jgi:HD-like signal output (HDOD) protein